MQINSNVQHYTKTFANQTANGVLGTASDLANCSSYSVTQTTANIALTLPTPTAGTNVKIRHWVSNTGTIAFTINGFNVPPNVEIEQVWDNNGWRLVGGSGASGQTYSGLQAVRLSTAELAITATNQSYDCGATLQESDLLEIQHQFNGSSAERQFFWVRVQSGTTQRAFPWADPTNNTHYITFPATLNSTFQIRQVGAGSSPRILSVKVWRDAANGWAIPTGTTTRASIPISINGTATTNGFTGTSMRVFAPVGTNRVLNAVTANNGATAAIADPISGAIELAIPDGATSVNITTTENTLTANDYYLGTWADQAGDITSTTQGHTCTRQRLSGNSITTTDESTFTLTGGVYKVRIGVIAHRAANTFRATSLIVSGTNVGRMFSGNDGSNWSSGASPFTWIVDATTTTQTVQARRTSSSGNGNCDGYLEIERVGVLTVPVGTVARSPVTITANSGAATLNGNANAIVMAGTSARLMLAVPTGQIVSAVTAPANVTAVISDERTGAIEVSVGNTVTGTVNLTVTFAAGTGRSTMTFANAGTWVAFGSISYTIPTSGNRSVQIRSSSGTISVRWQTWLGWDSTTVPTSASVNTSSAQYLNSGWNFGNAGNNHFALLEDTTNNRRYRMHVTIGNSYNNNMFWIEEVT